MRNNLYGQIIDIINGIKNDSIPERDIKRRLVELKKKFNMFRQNQRTKNGSMNANVIQELSIELLNLRTQRSYEDEENINSILQSISDEMEQSGNPKGAQDIRVEILGFKGTNSSNMSPAEIKEIIYGKIDKILDTSIPKEIINMVLEAFDNPYLASNIQEYQALVDDAIIPLVSGENNKLDDKRIITVLSRLAKIYKRDGDFKQAADLCNLGMELKQFSKTPEYAELKRECDSLNLYLQLEKNYRTVQIDLENKSLAQAIRDCLANENMLDVNPGGGDIFLKGTHVAGEPGDGDKERYQMSTEDKLSGIEVLLKSIQEELPDATVREIKVCKEGTFEGYVIIPIANTNITVFENLNDDVNEAIFIMDNEKIEDVIGKMTKTEAKQEDEVEAANHTDNFDGYTARLIKKAKSLLKYPEKDTKVKSVKRLSKEWYERFKNAQEKLRGDK